MITGRWYQVLVGATASVCVSGTICRSQTIIDTARFSAVARRGSEEPFLAEVRATGCAPLNYVAGAEGGWVNGQRRAAEKVRDIVVGNVPPRHDAQVLDRVELVTNDSYTLSRVLIGSRLGVIRGMAYVLAPNRSSTGPSPVVLMLHGSGTVPYQAFGMRLDGEGGLVTRADSTPFIRLGLDLVRAGFTVIAPVIGVTPPNGVDQLPWMPLSVWGEILREKTGKGGTETFLLSEIGAYIDYASDELTGGDGDIYVVGWNEGAYLGSLIAGIEPHVHGLVRLESPFDRKRYRNGVGMLRDASFTHIECTLGDVAQAAMLAGKPLMYAAAIDDANEVRRRGFQNPRITDSLRVVYAAFGQPQRLSVQIGGMTSPQLRQSVTSWLANQAGLAPASGPPLPVPRPSKRVKFEQNLVVDRINLTGTYLGQLKSCASVLPDVAISSAGPYAVARLIVDALGAARPQHPAARIFTREVIDSSRGYRLSVVTYGWDGSTRFRALLAEPPGDAPRPAVVSFNGTDGLNDLFDFGPRVRPTYMNGYADVLAKRGFVVIVPIIPFWVPNNLTPLTSARSLGRSSLWGILIDTYKQGIDVLLKVPGVDATKIAGYGISFGGVAAAIVTAVDPRITALVYNNIPVDYRSQFDKGSGAFLFTWLADACSAADASLLAVAPRPLIWEAGEDPLMLNQNSEVVTRVRARYRRLGQEENFLFTRHSGGHTTYPDNLRIFGR